MRDGFMLYNAKPNDSNWIVCPPEERHRASVGTYVYGIVISVVMIAAGLSGQFSGGGSGINIPLVAFGVFFLIIDVTMLLRARQAAQQAPQADDAQPVGAEDAQAEAHAEVEAPAQLQEAVLEVTPEVPIETEAEASAEAMAPAEGRAPVEEQR